MGASVINLTHEQVRVGFDRWAEVYDEQANPLTALEERTLSQVFPTVRGRDVLDVGCGTGRWLDRIAISEPRTLTGVDASAAMLERAAAKLEGKAILHHGDCAPLPADESSYDVLLCSFVLSYIADLQGFARECARVLRTGSVILLSDMHPVTVVKRGWKRSFQFEGVHHQMSTRCWELHSIIEAFEASGFEVEHCIEPCFDAPECPLFAAADRLAEFASLANVPAIYALVLRKTAHDGTPRCKSAELRLDGARYALTSQSTAQFPIVIEGARINLTSSASSTARSTLDLSGYLLLPGLINAHDHLEFGLYPRLGRPTNTHPYRDAEEWAKEIHVTHADEIARHRSVPLDTRLWWGGIRNLLCGVTTVCHHNPLHPELLRPGYPVRVVPRFGWAHSLAFDSHLLEKFRHTSLRHPFITHAGEGVDANSAEDIRRLYQMDALDDRTVLVHGVALTEDSAALMNERGAALVICFTSNEFLFRRTPKKRIIDAIDKVAIGSDSPLTAAGDLLDEVRYSHTHIGFESHLVYEMVTAAPAKILRLRDGEGAIRHGAVADIIAIRELGLSPAATVAQLTFEQVEMVMLGGNIQLASPSIYERLAPAVRQGMQALKVDGHVRWFRAPIAELFASAAKILGQHELLVGGKRMRHVDPL